MKNVRTAVVLVAIICAVVGLGWFCMVIGRAECGPLNFEGNTILTAGGFKGEKEIWILAGMLTLAPAFPALVLVRGICRELWALAEVTSEWLKGQWLNKGNSQGERR